MPNSNCRSACSQSFANVAAVVSPRVALQEGVSTEALKLPEGSMTDRSKCGQETSTNSDRSRPKMVPPLKNLTACSLLVSLSKLAITKVNTRGGAKTHHTHTTTHTHTHTPHWWLTHAKQVGGKRGHWKKKNCGLCQGWPHRL